jgi:hypothetical protein
MDTGLNTIEFYSGDISANFATSASPMANGGAQDNGSSAVTFSGSPTGPAQWQMGVGGGRFLCPHRSGRQQILAGEQRRPVERVYARSARE